MTAATPPVAPHTRDQRILSLRAAGWSLAAIGADVGLSAERVRQILARLGGPPATVEALESHLRAELAEVLVRMEDDAGRLRVLRRILRRLEEGPESPRHEELVELLMRHADDGRRRLVIERTLLRLEEEREAARIDRLLGLGPVASTSTSSVATRDGQG